MSRIDVVQNDSCYNVLLNFIQRGISYSSHLLANQEAEKLLKQYPQSELHKLEVAI
jgi:hypothetical protein